MKKTNLFLVIIFAFYLFLSTEHVFGFSWVPLSGTFAGRKWECKTGDGGPGNNHWGSSPQSVWIDSSGLHLKIRKVSSTWYCAEVRSVEPTIYGMHRFYINGRIDQLDKNVVASPFLYANDPQEIDIEFSTWGIDSGPGVNNAQFVVQPWDTPGNREQFIISLNGDYSTHYMNWQGSYIRFKSFHGHYTEPPDSGYLIRNWIYTGGDNPPESANLRIHINLWLIGGAPPSNGQEVEFIIKNADLPAPPNRILTVNSSSASSVNISSSTDHGGTTNYTKTIVSGTSVNLQAPQYVGSCSSRVRFNGWTGSVTSSNQSITFTMDGNKTVTANYVADPEISPGVPTGVSASDSLCDRIQAVWNSVSGATTYEIWRNTTNNSGSASNLGDDSSSPYNDYSAIAGTTYYYWVKAKNSCGTSGFSSSDSGYRASVPASAPTGVSATDGTYCDRVEVSWNTVSGATTYEMWRNTTNDSGSASNLGDDSSSPYDDSSAVAGTTYYYWVKAKNSCGTSGFSSSDPGYKATVPSAPTGVSATDGTYCGWIQVSWGTVSGGTTYEIYRNTINNSGSASYLGDDSSSPYDDHGIASVGIYYYCIKAKNNCGTSGFSSPDSGYVAVPPTITQHPQNTTVFVGQNANFAVVADGIAPLHYQWKKNGGNVGSDSPTLTLSNVQLSDNGAQITCDVSNICGTVTSNTAILTVLPTQFTITASAGANGLVEPNGVFDVNLCSNLLFTAEPNFGYTVDWWYLDSNAVQEGSATFNLSDIQTDHTVFVTFKVETIIYIDSVEDLQAICNTPEIYDANFILTADLDCNGANITPIGNSSTPFTGIFDGNGHVISNLTISEPTQDYISLFGYTSNATIQNLGVENVNIVGRNHIGGLVGFFVQDGSIIGCYADGSVNGSGIAGGIVGTFIQGSLTDCYANSSVSGSSNVGGLAGFIDGGILTDCYATGSVSGSSSTGGLVGRRFGGTLISCFWDIQTSGQTVGVGSGTSTGATGKTTAEMKQQATFASWDFVETWAICEWRNYPRLTWSIPLADMICPDGVDFSDFAILANHWLETDCSTSNDCNGTDLYKNGIVDLADLEILSEHWLKGVVSVPPTINISPNADAGTDQTVNDSDQSGSEQVTLNGSGSSDPDGSITSYVWTEGGSQIATGVSPNVTLSVGQHTITLQVTDDGGLTDNDVVVITIEEYLGAPPPLP